MEFKDRTGENLNRKKLKIISQSPTEMIVDMERFDEANEEGTKINASVFNTFQQEIDSAKSIVNNANSIATNANTKSEEAVNKAESAISIANGATEVAEEAKEIANGATTTANEAKEIAQETLELVSTSSGTKVTQDGIALATFESNTKADVSGDTFSGDIIVDKDANWGQFQIKSANNKYRAIEADDEVLRLDVRNDASINDRRFFNFASKVKEVDPNKAITIYDVQNGVMKKNYVATHSYVDNICNVGRDTNEQQAQLNVNSVIKAGSVINGVTYNSDTTLTSVLKITQNSTLKSGSTISQGSYKNTNVATTTNESISTDLVLYSGIMYFEIARCKVTSAYRGANCDFYIHDRDDNNWARFSITTYKGSISQIPMLQVTLLKANGTFYNDRIVVVANYHVNASNECDSNSVFYQIFLKTDRAFQGATVKFINESIDYRSTENQQWTKFNNITTQQGSADNIPILFAHSDFGNEFSSGSVKQVVSSEHYPTYNYGINYFMNGINVNNSNIENVNNIKISDTGPNEGIEWLNGNKWKICEAPNDLSNSEGNLQFVTDTTRRVTFDTSGKISCTTPSVSSNTNEVATTAWVREYICPAGAIMPFAGNNIPSGWLLCDGSELSRTTYADLFNAIGVLYNKEDDEDATKFRIPDLTSRFIEGFGEKNVGEYLEAELPNVTGYMDLNTWAFYAWGAFSARYNATGPSGTLYQRSVIDFSLSADCDIYKDDCETVQPPALIMKYIIKY